MWESSLPAELSTASSSSSRSSGRRRYTDNELPELPPSLARHILNMAADQQESSSGGPTDEGPETNPVMPDSTKPNEGGAPFSHVQETRPLDIPLSYPIVVSSDVKPRVTNTPTPPPQTHAGDIPSLYAMQDPIGAMESPPRPMPPFPSVAASAALTAPGLVGEAARKMLVDSLAAGMDPNVALYVSRLVARRMRNAISVGDDPDEALSQIVGTTAGRDETIDRALELLRNPDLLPEEAERGTTTWRPAELFLSGFYGNRFVLLILNQPIERCHVFRTLWRKAFYRIAADGGGNHVRKAFRDSRIRNLCLKSPLDAICGDLDSLEPWVQEWAADNGATIIQDFDQSTTDFAKCVDYLRDEVFPKQPGGNDVVCLGGIGGRVDQGMSVIHHLFKFQSEVDYASSRFYLVSSEAITFMLMPGKHHIRVAEDSNTGKVVLGRHIGIIPVGKASMISTKGLRWDVTHWHTEMGGQISTSNQVKDPICEIITTGPVLFTIELKISTDGRDTSPSDCH